MGQGEEVINEPAAVEIQERGEIYFFYRPKVGKEDPHSSDDVQRLYILLRPESAGPSSTTTQAKQDHHKDDHDKQPPTATTTTQRATAEPRAPKEVDIEKDLLLRFIVMGRKSLPDPAAKKSRPFWGFVELVTTKIQDVKDALKGEEYDTKTRGHRHKPAARALGEGVYRILKHHSGDGNKKKMHTHLVYKLEFPSLEAAGESQPQEDLNVEREGSYLIQIKNPSQNQQHQDQPFRGLEKKRRAVFPAHLQGLFGKLRYHAADPPDFLNYEGCEFLLISASDDIEKELGLEIHEEDASCSDLVKTFGETASTEPLLRGIWV